MRLFAAFLSLSVVAASKSFLDSIGPQNVSWTQCPFLAQGSTLMQCAHFQVPLDYDDLTKGNITLGAVRHPAKNQSQRIGSLFYNPGGPGGLPSSEIGGAVLADLFDPRILDSFDVVGVDLRGTGLSNPINCSFELFQDISQYEFTYLSDEESFNHAVDTNLKFRQSCKDLSNNTLVDYTDTASIAKDHEYVRRAIGNESITFFGESYETQLAVQYAELFPDSLRAVLLDGNNDLAQYNAALMAETAASMEAAMKYFFTWCTQQNATLCPLAHTNQTVEQSWYSLLNKSVAVSGPTAPTVIRATVYQLLYNPALTWPKLAQEIYLAVYFNNFTAWEAPAMQKSIYNASGDYAFYTVSCADRFHESSAVEMKLKELVIKSQAPLMEGVSPILGTLTGCVGWPYPSRNPPHKINIPQTSNNKDLKFMMVSTLYDPATSTWFTQTLQEQIGEDRAPVIMRIAGGHTTYFQPEARKGRTVSAMVSEPP
jgi:pimeloyl-ACP methyl ester carboxylesterase